MVFVTKIHSSVVFFVERWFVSLQDPFYIYIFWIFRGLFELDLLL